jgi:TolB-like protein/class 3 adenylate cyclase/Flp pilus assembly protein TadD
MKDNRKIAAILAADVVGYSRLIGADDVGTLATLQNRRAIFERLVKEFDGREFGCVGDSLMAQFDSVINAVRCARRIQHAVAEENETIAVERHMTLRIGINLGDVLEQAGQLYGDGVNIAARLQAIAAPGGIIVSGAVKEHVKDRLSVAFRSLGIHHVKNISMPIECFDVLEPKPVTEDRRTWRWLQRNVNSGRRRSIAAVGAMMVIGSAGIWYWHDERTSGERTTATASPTMHAALPAKSIAVLPFADMSAERDQAYMSDGIAEELLNLLAQIPDLKVIARTSSFSFKGQNVDVAEIARRLNVAHVVEGSVRKAGNRLRITAQLIRAADHTQLWSEHYDRPLGDIFRVQDEIAGAIVRALQIEMMGGTLPRRNGGTQNVKAYALSLQAHDIGFQFTASALEQSIYMYRQALELDPGYAEAWVGLGGIYFRQYNEGLKAPDEAIRLARAAMEEALELDPQNALAHAGLAWIAIYYDVDYESAARSLERALALDPTNIEIMNTSAILLRRLGRFDQAIELGEYLVARDPVNPESHEALALAYLYAGQWDPALEAYRTTLILSPQFIGGHGRIGAALVMMGNAEAALAEAQRETDNRWRLHVQSLAYHALGQAGASDAAFREFAEKYGSGLAVAVAHAAAFRGDNERAFEWLEMAARYRDPSLGAVPFHQLDEGLHNDSRWLPFLRKYGMAPEQLAPIRFNVTVPKR